MDILLIQLPIPQLNLGRKTGNIPLAAGCLKLAADDISGAEIRILPESIASYSGDAALLAMIISKKPDVIGFTAYNWNLERSLHLAREIKKNLPCRVVMGGPEITGDNPLCGGDEVDFFVVGDGEAAFQRLLENPDFWDQKSASVSSESIFKKSKSPYISNLMEPDIENLMLLETQRGCPHRCGYCYYNKSRKRTVAIPDGAVLEGIDWALSRGGERGGRVPEIFLLDPCLNARPGLKELLKKIGKINSRGRASFQSEIRAEPVDRELADLFVRAGFHEFEVGLQSVNKEALKIMNRPTDLQKFKRGVRNLKNVGITPKIDLIIGLPGDSLEGFKKSVDFVAEADFHDDIQVFFLSVLPGTDFRRRAGELGLRYESHPPYAVYKTPGFTQDDMMAAYFYAEDAFGVSLQQEPDLRVAYKSMGGNMDSEKAPLPSSVEGEAQLSKIIISGEIPLNSIGKMARRVTHPYQVIFLTGEKHLNFMLKTVEILTGENPFTPLEIIFIEPGFIPSSEEFDGAMKLQRPLYLDFDLPAIGSRTVLYTLVTSEKDHVFGGVMKRQVFRWTKERLPEYEEMETLLYLDGVLMDNSLAPSLWVKWQDRFVKEADNLPLTGFADKELEKRWSRLTGVDDFWEAIFTESF